MHGETAMKDNIISILNDYIPEALDATDKKTMLSVNEKYIGLLEAELPSTNDTGYAALIQNVFKAMMELALTHEKLSELSLTHSPLSALEKEENKKVQDILDNNLLTYHFQPIVSVSTAQIFAYEALMRAKDVYGITPFHILKYATMTDRLPEVEKLTFINVLTFVRENPTVFNDRPVFINSIPQASIDEEGRAMKELLLSTLPERIVVEMTESSEFSEEELNEIKRRYRVLHVPIAIDDYGTGYSNINNLLRYTPNYVKIDRSLLSGIQTSPNKKHFVREIVDFCHTNGILALAEGVETTEELRTVILLGVDLIQGFYTARPAAEVLQTLPSNIRSEINAFRKEREEGKQMKLYDAQSGENIILDRFAEEGYNLVRIGSDYQSGTVTLTGSAPNDQFIHVEISDGFSGHLILNGASLKNSVGNPCIEIGSGCDLTIELIKANRFTDGGIRVPESSMLRFEGSGSLDIVLGNGDYFGIGNDLKSTHGNLYFEQDGTISISAESYSGVLIGSGRGGKISMLRGKYLLQAKGSMNICVGAVDGDTEIEIHGCDFESNTSGALSITAGSVTGNSNIHCIFSSLKCKSDSMLSVAFGSMHKGSSRIFMESVHTDISLNADSLTVFGSMNEASDIRLERSSIAVDAYGTNSLVFGGISGDTTLSVSDIDINIKLNSEFDTCVIAPPDNISLAGGKYNIMINNNEYDRI